MNRLAWSHGAAVAVALLAVSGCTDLSQRWELDHARVLAVRLSAPGLAAGQTATVDALVVDDAGVPSVASPSVVTLAADLGAPRAGATPVTVAAGEMGWTVVASDAAAIAAARAAAGLADDQPLEVQLAAGFTVTDPPRAAVKRVRLGEALTNPAAPTIRVDGALAGDRVTVARGREVKLAVDGAVDDPTLSWSWLTSSGSLTYSETPAATLELAADDPADGHAVVIVRDAAGGVAWATVAFTAP